MYKVIVPAGGNGMRLATGNGTNEFFLLYGPLFGILTTEEMKTMLNTILFDLDGTLAPFVQEEFIRVYFQALTCRLTPHGV